MADPNDALKAEPPPGGWRARAALWRRDTSDRAIAQRVAGSAFAIRVFNAGLGFMTQILFARWMGEFEYGIYAYVWVWVLLLGGLASLGIASTTQRFIPEYTERRDQDGLRGYLIGAPLMVTGAATLLALFGLGLLAVFGSPGADVSTVVLAIGLLCLPVFVLADVQDGIARSYNWIDIALVPVYVVRPVLIIVFVALIALSGLPPTAVWVVGASVLAIALISLGQTFSLVRRLWPRIEPGPRRYEPRQWLKVALPVFMIDGFYLFLTYTDVLVLQAFASPEEVAVYYAATKVMALAALIYFAVSAATAHRFTEYAAAGDRDKLAAFVRDAARWTFWPTLVMVTGLVVMGKPFLWLFGPAFTQGYILLPILGLGILARASVGPCERLLSMLGEQNRAALVYGGVFLFNLLLNLILVPRLGMIGSAWSTAMALMLESVLLFVIARKRLGLHSFAFGGHVKPASMPDIPSSFRIDELDVEAASAHLAAWRDLVVRAAEPNGFYDPDFALATARNLPERDRVRFVMVWGGADLLGMVPIIRGRRRYLVPFPLAEVWPAYAPLGTPLLDRDKGSDVFGAVLDHLAQSGARALLMPRFSEGGTASLLATAHLAARGRRFSRIEPHVRALLQIGGDPAERVRDTISPKKAKELARLRRRLEETGRIEIETATDPAGVGAALERFLALEAAGWKGKRGTALASAEGRAAFVREAFGKLAPRGRAEVVLMRVGDKDVAGALVVRQSGRAFYFKTAYDEEAARYSPGVLLSLALTGMFLADPRLVDVDSVADADHPMIDHLWRGRLPIADWLVELKPADPLFDVARMLELGWRGARRGVHAVRRRVRRPPGS